MRIGLVLVRNFLACAYSLFGYRETLERMGHDVIECAFPGNQVQVTPEIIAKVPTIEQLLECDCVLLTYAEYTQPWIEQIYDFEQWQKLMGKVPVLARFDESMDRGDLLLPHRLPKIKKWATHYSFPAAQDADKYGGEWLPYGADTTIFHPPDHADLDKFEKKYDLAFIGTLYQKRHDYLMKMAPHIGKNVTFHSGNVVVQDIGGIRERETTELLAENYRQIRIFFCLPPMSRLLVEKIFDIMACDTFVMYPCFPDIDFQKNLSIFKGDKHIVYYDYGFYADNGKQVTHYLEHPEEVDRIARAGGELVRSKYTLEQMLEAMLTQVRSVRESSHQVRV